MTHSIASGTAHAVSHKLQTSFLKNCSKSILQSQNFVSQGQTDILAGNSGYSLYSSGSGEVKEVASTKHGKDKFNIVHFVCNCITATILNSNLLHNVYLFLPHLSASVFGHLCGACCSFVCSLYVNIFGNSLHYM